MVTAFSVSSFWVSKTPKTKILLILKSKLIFGLIFKTLFFTNTAFFVQINSNQSVDKKRNQRWKLWFQNLLDSHVALEWNIIYYRHTFVYEEVIWWANHDSALLETLSIRAKKAKKCFTFKSFNRQLIKLDDDYFYHQSSDFM